MGTVWHILEQPWSALVPKMYECSKALFGTNIDDINRIQKEYNMKPNSIMKQRRGGPDFMANFRGQERKACRDNWEDLVEDAFAIEEEDS